MCHKKYWSICFLRIRNGNWKGVSKIGQITSKAKIPNTQPTRKLTSSKAHFLCRLSSIKWYSPGDHPVHLFTKLRLRTLGEEALWGKRKLIQIWRSLKLAKTVRADETGRPTGDVRSHLPQCQQTYKIQMGDVQILNWRRKKFENINWISSPYPFQTPKLIKPGGSISFVLKCWPLVFVSH